jgi:hypothetical protein
LGGFVTPVYPLFISSSFLCYLYFFNHKFCRFVFCESLFFFMSILTIRLLWVLFFLILIMLLMWTWRSFCGSFWLQLCFYHCYIAFFSFNNLYFKISSIIIYVFWKLLVATRFFIPYIFQYFITIFWKLSSNATKLIFKCTDINSVFWMTSNLALKMYDHVGFKSFLDLVFVSFRLLIKLIVLYCIVLYCILPCIVLYFVLCIGLDCIVLYCIVLYCIMHCFVLYYIVFCIVLYCIL